MIVLIYLQGGWESDETVEEAACREALEEAGVRGVLKVRPNKRLKYLIHLLRKNKETGTIV